MPSVPPGKQSGSSAQLSAQSRPMRLLLRLLVGETCLSSVLACLYDVIRGPNTSTRILHSSSWLGLVFYSVLVLVQRARGDANFNPLMFLPFVLEIVYLIIRNLKDRTKTP